MKNSPEAPVIKRINLLRQRIGFRPYLRSIEEYWQNTGIIQPKLGFQRDRGTPDILIQSKHGLMDKSGTSLDFQLAVT